LYAQLFPQAKPDDLHLAYKVWSKQASPSRHRHSHSFSGPLNTPPRLGESPASTTSFQLPINSISSTSSDHSRRQSTISSGPQSNFSYTTSQSIATTISEGSTSPISNARSSSIPPLSRSTPIAELHNFDIDPEHYLSIRGSKRKKLLTTSISLSNLGVRIPQIGSVPYAVDGLEVVAATLLCARGTSAKKARSLFTLFNFSTTRRLCIDDFQKLIKSTILGLAKITNIEPPSPARLDRILTTILPQLKLQQPNDSTSFRDFLRWCYRCDEAARLLTNWNTTDKLAIFERVREPFDYKLELPNEAESSIFSPLSSVQTFRDPDLVAEESAKTQIETRLREEKELKKAHVSVKLQRQSSVDRLQRQSSVSIQRQGSVHHSPKKLGKSAIDAAAQALHDKRNLMTTVASLYHRDTVEGLKALFDSLDETKCGMVSAKQLNIGLSNGINGDGDGNGSNLTHNILRVKDENQPVHFRHFLGCFYPRTTGTTHTFISTNLYTYTYAHTHAHTQTHTHT
jgi:hypothetical protein